MRTLGQQLYDLVGVAEAVCIAGVIVVTVFILAMFVELFKPSR
jgi:hypothetical protein